MGKKAQHFWVEPSLLSSKGIDFCSLEAQGLWLKLMCLLHASERYGYLTRDGNSVSDEQTARRCGIDVHKWIALRDELLEFNLLKRTADGIIFSPELVAQAEWRSKEAKRQKNHQSKKRETKISRESNGTYNGEYNGYITPDITDESRSNINLNSFSSSDEKEKGGGYAHGRANGNGKPPPAAAAHSNGKAETQKDYLLRKQLEFPQLDIEAVFQDFSEKCGSPRYPNLKNSRGMFDRWLDSEHLPMSPAERQNYVNPQTGKALK